MGVFNNLEMKIMKKVTGKDCQVVSAENLAAMFKEYFIDGSDFASLEQVKKAAKGSRFRKRIITSKSGRYIFRSSRKRGWIITSRSIYIEDTEQKVRYYLNRAGYHKKFYKLVEQHLNKNV